MELGVERSYFAKNVRKQILTSSGHGVGHVTWGLWFDLCSLNPYDAHVLYRKRLISFPDLAGGRRSGQVRKLDFFDWLFQNMAITALKFERALRGFSGPLGNSMSVFMQIRHCARNHNICILGTFRCLLSASKVKKISSQFFIAL